MSEATILIGIGMGRAGIEIGSKAIAKLIELTNKDSDNIYRLILVDTAADAITDIQASHYFENIKSISKSIIISNWNDVNEYMSRYEQLKSSEQIRKACEWFPWDDSNIAHIIKNISLGVEGVGRNRIISRFIFECIPNVYEKVKEHIKMVIKDTRIRAIEKGIDLNRSAIMIWLFSSLGGGTGSGAIITILKMLKEIINELNLKTKVLPLLIVSNEPYADERNMVNTYAALKDLACAARKMKLPISLIKVVGFNESKIMNIDTIEVYKGIDEKIIDYIIGIHKIPLRSNRAGIVDWQNMLEDQFTPLLETHSIPLSIIDTVKIGINIDDLIKYIYNRVKLEKLTKKLGNKNENIEPGQELFNYIGNEKRFMENLNNQIRAIETLYGKYNFLSKTIEELNNRRQQYYRGIYSLLNQLINNLKNQLKNDNYQKELKEQEKELRKYQTKPENLDRTIINNFKTQIENILNAYKAECDKKRIFKTRCNKHYKNLMTMYTNTFANISNTFRDIDKVNNYINDIEIMKNEINEEIRKTQTEINATLIELDNIQSRLIGDNPIKIISSNYHVLLFSRDGLEKLYNEHIRPVLDSDERLRERIRELSRHGIQFYIEYLVANEERILSSITNALSELSILPLNVDFQSMVISDNIVYRRRLKDYIVPLFNGEDKALIVSRLVLDREQFASQITYISNPIMSENIGPMAYFTRIITSVHPKFIGDIVELKKLYDETDRKLPRHAFPEAIEIDIVDMEASEIQQKCASK